MIKNILLKFGRATGLPKANIETTPVTVFVGPNNSGKSQVLQEIYRFCTSGTKSTNDVVLDSLVFDEFSEEKAIESINHVKLTPNRNEALQPDHIIVGKRGSRHQVGEQSLIAVLRQPNQYSSRFCSWYLAYNTIILDGKNRINLVNQQSTGDLQLQPQTSFQALFRDDAKRQEVRRIIKDAFDLYFVIDPTNLGNLRLRLSSRPPQSNVEERGIHEESVKFHSEALSIEFASDGVKAFTGIITEIIAGDPKVLLIDEPEAFLHPSLSYKLGKEIAQASVGVDKRIFVSTHSSSFVMGCIQSGAPVNIVRLTYRDGSATARILPNNEILRLMKNPLLRSTGVLEGLFYEFVVVTESDADRAFYQEINDRLLHFNPEWGIPNCLFINAQNKQTVQTIIKPLRQLGIPTAGIVDVDILKEGGSVWSNHLSAGFIPDIEHEPLSRLRSSIIQRFDSIGVEMKQNGGIDLLSNQDREAANNLFDQMDSYGLFTVRKGELESWLRYLGVSAGKHGPAWLIEIFEKMGEDPEQANYLKPSNDDIWLFMSSVKKWFSKIDKKGIPI
ncbi:MAG: ATP-binding protein [Anaerolineales bacterium]|nr:ATP-binding protein [Anaerolineales bacterium]